MHLAVGKVLHLWEVLADLHGNVLVTACVGGGGLLGDQGLRLLVGDLVDCTAPAITFTPIG